MTSFILFCYIFDLQIEIDIEPTDKVNNIDLDNKPFLTP